MDSTHSGKIEQSLRRDLDGVRVLNVFTDPRLGGPGNRALAVANELSSYGVESGFLIPHGSDELISTVRDAGHEAYQEQLPRIRSPRLLRKNATFLGTFPQTVCRVRDRIREYGADIVHVNTPYNFQPALAASMSDASLVWHFNDTLTPTPIRHIAAIAAKNWANEIIVASDAVHNYFFNKSVGSRTIYPPVDFKQFDPQTVDGSEFREEFGINPETCVVGTVGNLNPIKGHDTLIKSIPKVITENKNLTVFIAGQELESCREYAKQLQELVERLGIKDSVRFLGWRNDIPKLLDALDVFVLSSVSEGCPTVILEAMAMETPVVATDVGGVSEQIPDTDYGWVVPPEDPAALGRALTDALSSSPERMRRFVNARERAKETFSLDACVEKHKQTYSDAIRDN